MNNSKAFLLLDIISIGFGVLGLVSAIAFACFGDEIQKWVGAILVSLVMIGAGVFGILSRVLKK